MRQLLADQTDRGFASGTPESPANVKFWFPWKLFQALDPLVDTLLDDATGYELYT